MTIKVNIIYSPQDKDATTPRFKNDKGEVWMNKTRKDDMHNISMSFYSANYPDPIKAGDSIYIIEPRCVAERDYDIDFLDKFRYIFTWSGKSFEGTKIENKIIHLHHPSCFGFGLTQYEYLKKNKWLPWEQRRKEIAIIANNKSSNHYSELYSLRLEMAESICRSFKNYKVSWYGQIPLSKPYYKGTIKDKSEVLSRVRFTLCTENSYDPKFSHNYFTEKMPEAWFNGAIPLYMGCFNINDFGFNDQSYIDLRRYVNKNKKELKVDYNSLFNKIKSVNNEQYQNVVNAIDYNIYNANLFDKISEEKIMEKMIEVFSK